jgi:hypothetical protein
MWPGRSSLSHTRIGLVVKPHYTAWIFLGFFIHVQALTFRCSSCLFFQGSRAGGLQFMRHYNSIGVMTLRQSLMFNYWDFIMSLLYHTDTLHLCRMRCVEHKEYLISLGVDLLSCYLKTVLLSTFRVCCVYRIRCIVHIWY